MKKRFVLFSGVALTLLITTFFSVDQNSSAKTVELASLLPDSDGVMTIDTQRLVGSALPTMLSSNPKLLLKINGEVEKFKQNSGMDLRSFDRIAVGMKYAQVGDSTSLDMVMLARGSSAVTDLERVAKIASKGEYSKTTAGARTIYLFSGAKLIKDKKPNQIDGSFFEGTANKFMSSLSGELALTAYDSNTIAFGNKERVMAAIGNNKRVSNELLTMINKNSGSLGAISMNTPAGVSEFIEMDDDELGTMLDSIRSMHGKLDLVDGVTKISVAAVTSESGPAEDLAITIDAMKGFGAKILKGNKGADKKAYGRMLENLTVEQTDKEVSIELSVPQADMDVIISRI